MTSKEIRPIIKQVPGAWVRCWRDGEVWCGVRSMVDFDDLCAALTQAGIDFEHRPGERFVTLK